MTQMAQRSPTWNTVGAESLGIWVFHEGFFVSAIRRDGTGIVVMRRDYQPVDEFVDVDDWYVGLIRPELAGRYGL